MSHSNATDPFSELLTPVKDPEKSFEINISELLENYVKSFIAGSINFNSAALMIQGSSCIYSKKVEYLLDLAEKLYASLVKNKKEDGGKKETKERGKHTKESKFSDPFFSTEIKPGKNLSCLRKKISSKNAASKRASKKADKKCTYTPVDLIQLEDGEKGMEIRDSKGHKLGKKNEFTLNKCKVTSSGWLLLPTVSPNLIPSRSSDPEYSNEDLDDNMCNDSDCDMPESSPLDEGYPPSSGCSETPTSVPSSEGISSVPSSQETDEGLGSLPCTPLENGSQPESTDNTPTDNASPVETPMEVVQEEPDGIIDGIEGNENIPLEGVGVAPMTRRSESRQALPLSEIQEENTDKDEVVVIKRAIQKKNTYNLPSKLKGKNGVVLHSAAEYCCRTFFSTDRNYPKRYNHVFEMACFEMNRKIFAKFRAIQAIIYGSKQSQRKKDKPNAAATAEDSDEEIDPGGIECNLADPAALDDLVTTPLEAADIVIENNPVLPNVSNNENPLAEDEPMVVEDLDNGFQQVDQKELEDSFKNAAKQQCDLFRGDLQKYAQTSDISERVREWELTMRPFLEKLNKREEFDIDLYGSRILNAFEESNRKQTITFRNFCKDKEKWEIHRYFMALLPLVNIGNVSIERCELDGDEDIGITLLSRKMHHKELEEFGHSEGEHP